MFGKHLSKLSEDGAGTRFGPLALRRAMEHMKMPKLSTQQSKLLFQSLNAGTCTALCGFDQHESQLKLVTAL